MGPLPVTMAWTKNPNMENIACTQNRNGENLVTDNLFLQILTRVTPIHNSSFGRPHMSPSIPNPDAHTCGFKIKPTNGKADGTAKCNVSTHQLSRSEGSTYQTAVLDLLHTQLSE